MEVFLLKAKTDQPSYPFFCINDIKVNQNAGDETGEYIRCTWNLTIVDS